ncbi:MAG: 2Fe-2S iron-sulfur cluster binding domain-containing protein, partial [Candidatus Tectomicrobia bacterium]|nr:2Fe-2S iron-sulfur cluster binding domain-containing protein [Candidatus Tectomicrobia bacterium]
MSPSPGWRALRLLVNGQERREEVRDNILLLDLLREELGLRAAREGCGVGACGSCTVLV